MSAIAVAFAPLSFDESEPAQFINDLFAIAEYYLMAFTASSVVKTAFARKP
jgi:hypothetical protein